MRHAQADLSQGSVEALNKSPQPENKHAKRRADLRGKTFAEQESLLAPEEDRDKDARRSEAGSGRRDKQGPAKTQKVYPPDVQKALERWPAGVAMTFYPDYPKDSHQYAHGEFEKQATSQSKAIGAVSLIGGKLELGKTHKINDQATIVEQANAVSSYLAGILSPEDLALNKHKLAQLHVYAHGWGTGMSTGANRKGQKGNMSSKGMEAFVGAISGSLRSDVNVALFACSTGKDMDKKSKKKDIDEVDDGSSKPKGKEREHGEGSFADKMRDELVKQGHSGANVGGHTTAGHMSGNTEGRYFTGDGPAASFFDTIFPEAWRAKEATKVKMSEKDFAKQLKKWFTRYTKYWRTGKKGKKKAKLAEKDRVDMGYLMMVDPAQAKDVFHLAWEEVGGNFHDVSPKPHVDWSKVGARGADSATEARNESDGGGAQLIDL